MATRGSGFIRTVLALERTVRQQRIQAARREAQAARLAASAQRQRAREYAATEKDRRRLHVEAQTAEADAQTEELEAIEASLQSILSSAMGRQAMIDLDSLKEVFVEKRFEPGSLDRRIPPPTLEEFLPPPLGALAKLMPGAKEKHEQKVAEAQAMFEKNRIAHQKKEERRLQDLTTARAEHEAKVAAELERVRVQHATVEQLKEKLRAGEPDAVTSYYALVLERSLYPEGFPGEPRLTYQAAQKELVVDFDLPTYDIVPEAARYKYVKSSDEIAPVARPQKDRRTLYSSLIAQTVLRTMHEVFTADKYAVAEAVIFNGFVSDIDKATGRKRVACVVSVRAPSDAFAQLALSRVDPVTCVRGLHGSMSKAPEELTPIKGEAGWNAMESVDSSD